MRIKDLTEAPIGQMIGGAANKLGNMAGSAVAGAKQGSDLADKVIGTISNPISAIKNKFSGSSTTKPANKQTKSPFDILSNRESKELIGNILNGQELTSSQKFKLEKIYRNL